MDFDALREVQRRERESQKLVPIGNDFWKKASEYMHSRLEKYSELKAKGEGKFIDKVLFQLERELSNAASILMEIYTLREKKIMQLAWADVASDEEIDTSNLTDEELKLFEALKGLLSKAREAMLDRVLRGEEIVGIDLRELPISEDSLESGLGVEETPETPEQETEELEEIEEQKSIKTEEELEEISEEEQELQLEEKIREEEKKETKTEENLVRLRILSHVPAFLGTDLKLYGPFQEGEIVELPKKYAKLLIEKKKATIAD